MKIHNPHSQIDSLRDYQIDLDWFDEKRSIKILHLTDIHWECDEGQRRKASFLNALVKNADPDFIVLGGDQATNPSKERYQAFFEVLEGFSKLLGRDLYYGLVWGNHDHDNRAFWGSCPSRELLKNFPHCLYLEVEDSLTGKSNYVFNFRKEGKTLWQAYCLDCNSTADYPTEPKRGYDTIHEEQVDWFKKEVLEAKKESPNVKNLVFFHMPLWETEYAYRISQGDELSDYHGKVGYLGRFSGVVHERREPRGELGMSNMCTSNVRSSFFEAAESLGATAALIYGHDHINDFAAE